MQITGARIVDLDGPGSAVLADILVESGVITEIGASITPRGDVEVVAAEPVAEPVAEVPARRSRPAEPFDVRAFDEPTPEPAPVEPPAPGTWVPTPVPAPLYTRKAQYVAPQPMPVQAPVEAAVEPPAELAPVVPLAEVMVPVDIDDDVLEASSPYRRVVNG